MLKPLIFKVNGKSYHIEFPRVGQYRNIETLKQSLSANNYGGMYRTLLVSANEALDMIDIEAYLTVLCPDLIDDLRCDSFAELGLYDYSILRDAFKEQFIPWWNDVEKTLRPNKAVEVKDEKS